MTGLAWISGGGILGIEVIFALAGGLAEFGCGIDIEAILALGARKDRVGVGAFCAA